MSRLPNLTPTGDQLERILAVARGKKETATQCDECGEPCTKPEYCVIVLARGGHEKCLKESELFKENPPLSDGYKLFNEKL